MGGIRVVPLLWLVFFWGIGAAAALPRDSIIVEAETPVRVERPPFVVNDAEASGGQAVDVPAQVRVFYTIRVPKAGRWYVWVRMFAKNPNADSVWVGSDGGLPTPRDNSRPDPALRFYAGAGDSVTTDASLQVWYWDPGMAKTDPHASLTFSKAGDLEIWIKGRETGTLVDTILLTQDETFDAETELRGGPLNQGLAQKTETPRKAREAVALGTEFPLWKPWPAVAQPVSVPEEFREAVVDPTFRAFIPPEGSGAAVLILPGGGYLKLLYRTEGTAIARWLNENGIAAFVLSYRLPGNRGEIEEAAADTRQALRLIAEHAESWGIDPARLGVMGFSAGAHLAATVGLTDPTPSGLRFLALIYPSLPTLPAISRQAPDTFLAVSRTDSYISSDRVVGFYQQLRAAGIPSELHVFSTGPHGFGVSTTNTSVDHWKDLALGWMRDLHVIP